MRQSRAAIPRAVSFAMMAACVVAGSVRAARADDAAADRGAALFKQYCVVCHGKSGKGDGRAAHLQKTPPANLTVSTRSDAYKTEIVTRGGAAMNRSESMPAWGDVLSAKDIGELVTYLRMLCAERPAAVP